MSGHFRPPQVNNRDLHIYTFNLESLCLNWKALGPESEECIRTH